MKYLVIVMAVVFVLYVLWIALRFGIKKSISESYYVLEYTGHGYLFTLFMIFIMICMMSATMLTEHEYSWTFFLAGSGAAFVGLAATFYAKVTRTAHFFGAVLLILMSLLGIGLVYGNWTPMFLTGVTALVFYILKNKDFKVIYWFEIAAFVFIIVGLWIQ